MKLRKDEYERLEKIAEGTYGVVFKARRKSDGAVVAVKVVQTRHPARRIEYYGESKAKVDESMGREISFLQKIAAVSSPGKRHFVELLDEGVVDGRPALAMTLCDFTLAQWYARRRKSPSDYPFDAELLLKWMRQSSSALLALRELAPQAKKAGTRLLTAEQMEADEGFALRDLKPDNILVEGGPAGDLRLSDFGTARQLTSRPTATIGCTPDWAAPECLVPKTFENGEAKFALTPKVDVYSLGLVFHFLISGRDETAAQRAFFGYPHIQVAFGAVGGLTRDEKNFLRACCRSLFSPGEGGKTIGVGNNLRVLPDVDYAADLTVDLVERMMAPLASKRPSARGVSQSVKRIEDALHPAAKIELDVPETALPDTALSALVRVEGRGIPEHCDWLHVWIDGNIVEAEMARVLLQDDCDTADGTATASDAWKVKIPAFPEEGEFEIAVFAMVSGKRAGEKKKIRVEADAEWLWSKGRRAAALAKDPLRPEWLRQLDDEAAKDPSFLPEYAAILEKALEKHPELAKLNKRYWWIRDWIEEKKGRGEGSHGSHFFPFGPHIAALEKGLLDFSEKESGGEGRRKSKDNSGAPVQRLGNRSVKKKPAKLETKLEKHKIPWAMAIFQLLAIAAAIVAAGCFLFADVAMNLLGPGLLMGGVLASLSVVIANFVVFSFAYYRRQRKRFVKLSDDEVLDRRWNLIWYARDNGTSIPYRSEKERRYDAMKYLQDLNRDWDLDPGNQWRLPSKKELLSLYNKKAKKTPVESGGYVKIATDLIHVTGCWFCFEDDLDNPGSRFGVVLLGDGGAGSGAPWDALYRRVLVVRRGN